VTEFLNDVKSLFRTRPKLALLVVANSWFFFFVFAASLGVNLKLTPWSVSASLLGYGLGFALNKILKSRTENDPLVESFGILPKFERSKVLAVVSGISTLFAALTAVLLGASATIHFYLLALAPVKGFASLGYAKEAD
jgi:hypothetical protein